MPPHNPLRIELRNVLNNITVDPLLPSQAPERHQASGERRLTIAVLEEAALTYLKYHPSRFSSSHISPLFLEAKEWFDSEDREWLFSFRSICTNLGLNASYFRRMLYENKPAPRIIEASVRGLGPNKVTQTRKSFKKHRVRG